MGVIGRVIQYIDNRGLNIETEMIKRGLDPAQIRIEAQKTGKTIIIADRYKKDKDYFILDGETIHWIKVKNYKTNSSACLAVESSLKGGELLKQLISESYKHAGGVEFMNEREKKEKANELLKHIKKSK